MNFKKYGYKALTKIGGELYEKMKDTNKEDTAGEYYVWHDLYMTVQAELDRRVLKDQANEDIRQMIQDKRLHHYEIAALIGIDNCTFSKWLRTPLSEERRQAVLRAIENTKA